MKDQMAQAFVTVYPAYAFDAVDIDHENADGSKTKNTWVSMP